MTAHPTRAPDTELFNFHPPRHRVSTTSEISRVGEPSPDPTPAPHTRLADGNATGNVVYVFNLKFVSRFGVDQHFRMSSEGWGDHELLMVRANCRPKNPRTGALFLFAFFLVDSRVSSPHAAAAA